MTEKSTKRSGMLGTIYKMLPNIDDDYAAKLVYTLESTKTLPRLQQDIADIAAQLGQTNAMADTIVAKILLDEITLPAALRQLRVYNNAIAISELTNALDCSAQDTDLLLNYYASFGSRRFFDTEFAAALKDVRDDKTMPDADKAQHALDILLSQSKQDLSATVDLPQKNKKAIYTVADKYHLSVQTTAALLNTFTVCGAADFRQLFTTLFDELQKINANEKLNASLAAKTMLCFITPKDAQAITLTSHLLNDQILEEDLMIIACRYLKEKTPQDIVDTFQAVLKRLPHVQQKEENLGLAVQVLLDGTEATFEKAQKKASLRRERILLCQALSQHDTFAGYEHELAQHFAGHKDFEQIQADVTALLDQLPYCQDSSENKELACKVLLGTISPHEAQQQAEYLRDLKAKTLTKGLAPRVLKNYLGTKPADEIMAFFEKTLSSYTFWKSNQAAHEFALQALVEELNGTSNATISQFVLEMLENGTSLELVGDMLANIYQHKNNPEELAQLLARYHKARLSAKETEDLTEK